MRRLRVKKIKQLKVEPLYTQLELHVKARGLRELMDNKVTFYEAYRAFKTTLKIKEALQMLRLISKTK